MRPTVLRKMTCLCISGYRRPLHVIAWLWLTVVFGCLGACKPAEKNNTEGQASFQCTLDTTKWQSAPNLLTSERFWDVVVRRGIELKGRVDDTTGQMSLVLPVENVHTGAVFLLQDSVDTRRAVAYLNYYPVPENTNDYYRAIEGTCTITQSSPKTFSGQFKGLMMRKTDGQFIESDILEVTDGRWSFMPYRPF
jgi:hypothetical protein